MLIIGFLVSFTFCHLYKSQTDPEKQHDPPSAVFTPLMPAISQGEKGWREAWVHPGSPHEWQR